MWTIIAEFLFILLFISLYRLLSSRFALAGLTHLRALTSISRSLIWSRSSCYELSHEVEVVWNSWRSFWTVSFWIGTRMRHYSFVHKFYSIWNQSSRNEKQFNSKLIANKDGVKFRLLNLYAHQHILRTLFSKFKVNRQLSYTAKGRTRDGSIIKFDESTLVTISLEYFWISKLSLFVVVHTSIHLPAFFSRFKFNSAMLGPSSEV